MERFDLIVIGAGSGGLTAVDFAVKLGARVALVEKNRIGGDCTWTGCVPSKALLHAAKVAQTTRTAARIGVTVGPMQIDMTQVRDYVQSRIDEIYRQETPDMLRRNGVELFLGAAQFLDAYTIQVDTQILTAPKFIIATGAHPVTPPIPGLDGVNFHTYETIFDNGRLPQHLLVLGAGPVGLEIGQAYGRLGAQVTLIDEAILPGVDAEVSGMLAAVLADEGIRIEAGLATAVSQQNRQITVTVNDKTRTGDMLFVATGRRPNVAGLGLDKAGIHYSKAGIAIDVHLRTNQKHIFAVGDCTGGYQFTHYAGWQAFTAVRNALLPGQEKGVRDTVPWVLFTDPEVAQTGLTESAARRKFGNQVQVTKLSLDRVDRAIIDNQTHGFIKLIHRSDGKLLGATIAAAHAGEFISEFTLAMQEGIKLRDLAKALHVYPSLGIGAQLLATDWATKDFLDSALGRVAIRLGRLGREDVAGEEASPTAHPEPQTPKQMTPAKSPEGRHS